MKTRKATIADAGVLATLLADYLRERYPGHPGSTAEQLRRGVLGEWNCLSEPTAGWTN